jgi:hypothetical protein
MSQEQRHFNFLFCTSKMFSIPPASDQLHNHYSLLLMVPKWMNLPWTHKSCMRYIIRPIKKLVFITSSWVKMKHPYKTYTEIHMTVINELDTHFQYELHCKETHSSCLISK